MDNDNSADDYSVNEHVVKSSVEELIGGKITRLADDTWVIRDVAYTEREGKLLDKLVHLMLHLRRVREDIGQWIRP